jgi:predicted DNA-binding protein with PD1-like motif
MIRLDRGEELTSALVRAIDEAEAKAGWITGTGALDAAELARSEGGSGHDRVRRLDGPSTIVSLGGAISRVEGVTSVRLTVTLARESDVGLQLLAGQLVSGTVASAEVFVTVLDDVPPMVVIAEPAAAPQLVVDAPRATHMEAPHAPPVRPVRAVQPEENDIYPEPGDLVNHFHFGECEVVSSDGDRIRLRQGPDGRVREVALSMLRIEAPTVHESGARHFQLARKIGGR